MTPKEAFNYNRMLAALKTMTNGYQTTAQLRRNCEKQYGLDFEETIEMAYENMQALAKQASKGIRPVTLTATTQTNPQ